MSGKRAGGSSKVVGALAGAAAAFVARKVLFFGWKKVTGKEPPEHPEDPQVALTEALMKVRVPSTWVPSVACVMSSILLLATPASLVCDGSV